MQVGTGTAVVPKEKQEQKPVKASVIEADED